MQELTKCLYRIPFCGFFGPTKHPESNSCLRRFSNEYTLPCSCCFMQVSPWCETSGLCRAVGKLGMTGAKRECCLVAACSMSFFSLLLLGMALLGSSHSLDFVNSFSWSHTQVGSKLPLVPVNASDDAWRDMSLKPWVRVQDVVDVGVQGAQFHSRIWLSANYDHAHSDIDLKEVLFIHRRLTYDIANATSCTTKWGEDMCKHCGSVYRPVFALTFIALLLQIPIISLDLQRSTKFGDVNCVKSLNLILNILSIAFIGAAFHMYYHSCHLKLSLQDKYFVDGFENDINAVTDDMWKKLDHWLIIGGITTQTVVTQLREQLRERLKMEFSHKDQHGLELHPVWAFGYGIHALFFAIALKVLCIIAHGWMRTPKPRYDSHGRRMLRTTGALYDYLHEPYKNTKGTLLGSSWLGDINFDGNCQQTEMVKKHGGFKKPVALRLDDDSASSA